MERHLLRQIDHWRSAVHRLRELDAVAAPTAWAQLEGYTGIALRARLNGTLRALEATADGLHRQVRSGNIPPEQLYPRVQALRQDYLRTEVTLDYFGDAINTRTRPQLGNHLMALDRLAGAALTRALQPMGFTVPPVLTYLDKGLGASILKAGLRLWDRRGVNPVAVIKVVRHNLYRPTALIHEAGHQISYVLNWNDELAAVLRKELDRFGNQTAATWASWSSEIAADAFAFIFTGYAAVATLQDVLSGGPGMVFNFHPGNPHPIPYLRTLLAVAMCHHVFGEGPWRSLGEHWRSQYTLNQAPPELRKWLAAQEETLPQVAALILDYPMKAFGGQSLRAYLPPEHLQPSRLLSWGAGQGSASGWTEGPARNRPLDLLAYSVYKQATESGQGSYFRKEMDQWFSRLAGQYSPTLSNAYN